MALLLPGVASAAAITFVPAGTQLDADPILDIATKVGDTVTFQVFLDTTGLGGPLLSLNYTARYDNLELQLKTFDLDVPDVFTNSRAVGPEPDFFPRHSGGNIAANTKSFLLDTVSFEVIKGLIDDKTSDFRIGAVLDALTTVGDESNKFTGVPQEVEVQPVPEAGWGGMALMGGAAALTRRRGHRGI